MVQLFKFAVVGQMHTIGFGFKLMNNNHGVTAMANRKRRNISIVFMVLSLLATQFAVAGVIEINNSRAGSSIATFALSAETSKKGAVGQEIFASSGSATVPNNSSSWAAQSASMTEYAYDQDTAALSSIQMSVPKSESYAMMLVGFGLLGFSVRRKNPKNY